MCPISGQGRLRGTSRGTVVFTSTLSIPKDVEAKDSVDYSDSVSTDKLSGE